MSERIQKTLEGKFDKIIVHPNCSQLVEDFEEKIGKGKVKEMIMLSAMFSTRKGKKGVTIYVTPLSLILSILFNKKTLLGDKEFKTQKYRIYEKCPIYYDGKKMYETDLDWFSILAFSWMALVMEKKVKDEFMSKISVGSGKKEIDLETLGTYYYLFASADDLITKFDDYFRITLSFNNDLLLYFPSAGTSEFFLLGIVYFCGWYGKDKEIITSNDDKIKLNLSSLIKNYERVTVVSGEIKEKKQELDSSLEDSYPENIFNQTEKKKEESKKKKEESDKESDEESSTKKKESKKKNEESDKESKKKEEESDKESKKKSSTKKDSKKKNDEDSDEGDFQEPDNKNKIMKAKFDAAKEEVLQNEEDYAPENNPNLKGIAGFDLTPLEKIPIIADGKA